MNNCTLFEKNDYSGISAATNTTNTNTILIIFMTSTTANYF